MPELEQMSAEEKLRLAQECKDAEPEKYCNCLTQLFAVSRSNRPQTYVELMKMPFKGYLTINFDPILMSVFSDASKGNNNIGPTKSFPQGFGQIYSYTLRDLPGRKLETRSLYYLHGHATSEQRVKLEDLVLTTRDFEEAYHQSSPLPHILHQAFAEYSVVFIGCSLSEEPLQHVLRNCRAIRDKARDMANSVGREIRLPRLVRLVETPAHQTKLESELGIEVLEYPRMGDDHYGLVHLLREALGSNAPPIVASGYDLVGEANEL
ncbi:MAG: SIR2 family protein [Planctomycetes bacterium]|nr:SIR2 family protein [Planctomycetota bacterium]